MLRASGHDVRISASDSVRGRTIDPLDALLVYVSLWLRRRLFHR